MTEPANASLIGGSHAVFAALKGGGSVYRVWRVAGATRHNPSLDSALAERGLASEAVERSVLDNWLPDIAHQGIAAEVAPPEPIDEQQLKRIIDNAGETSLVLLLDQVQDPHNLGACLRSAAAAGVDAVIAPRRRAAGLTATAIKVAAGGAQHVPFACVTNLARTLGSLQAAGYFAVGLDGQAQTTIDMLDLTGRRIIVAGGEARGLRRRSAECCDELGAIPLDDAVASLNVSVAVGITLFEARRQHRAGQWARPEAL